MPPGPNKPVISPSQLDEIKNWAEAGLEDDPSDTFPRVVLDLIEENDELRLFLHRDPDGQLDLLRKVTDAKAHLEEQVSKLSQEGTKLRKQLNEAETRIRQLIERIEKYAAVLHKVEVLLHIARTRMADDGTVPTQGAEEISNLMHLVEQDYDTTKASRTGFAGTEAKKLIIPGT